MKSNTAGQDDLFLFCVHFNPEMKDRVISHIYLHFDKRKEERGGDFYYNGYATATIWISYIMESYLHKLTIRSQDIAFGLGKYPDEEMKKTLLLDLEGRLNYLGFKMPEYKLENATQELP